MRRIFGGPTLPANGHDLHSSSSNFSGRPPSLADEPSRGGGGGNGNGGPKGWFGAVADSLGTTTSVTRSRVAAGAAINRDEDDDEHEDRPLPFSGARPLPLTLSEYGGNVYEANGGRASVLGASTLSEDKDSLMVELLSGQAAVEAKDYAILDWDTMHDLKKEHAVLATRIAALSRSVALETKLRDSAAKLVRLAAPAALAGSTTSTRPRATREQAEQQLSTASAKLASLSTELHRVGWTEAAVRTKLLQHTAGVLALSVRRREEEDSGRVVSPLPSSTGHRDTPSPNSSDAHHKFDGASFFAGNREAVIPTTPRFAPAQWASSPPPPPSLPSFPTPPLADVSAPLIKSLEAKLADLRAQLAATTADLTAATSRADRAEFDSADALSSARGASSAELTAARDSEQSARDDLATARREAADSRREAADLRREVDSSRDLVREAKDATSVARKELQDAQRDLADGRRAAMIDRRGSTDAQQREMSAARADATELSKKVSMARLEAEEASPRAEGAEDRVAELEQLVARAEAEVRRLRAAAEDRDERGTDAERRLRDELERLCTERAKTASQVGDVLRRHRTRGVIGPALRDLPSFDDTTDHADLPSYLAQTLEQHFDRVSSHVSTLSASHDADREEHDNQLESLKQELREAVEHRERWRSEAESHRRAAETAHSRSADLERSSATQAERLSALQSVESALTTAQAEEQRLRTELSALQARLAAADARDADQRAEHARALTDAASTHSKSLADTATAHTKALSDLSASQAKQLKPLQDLWRSMPPLEQRQQSSTSDDLATLRAAFETPKRPLGNFLADVTSSGKFSIESLGERVRILLAEDLRLVNKLIAIEQDKEQHKVIAEKATKAEKDARQALASHQRQVKELEERMEVSSKQEVTMLERLNDLTESLEQTRGEKRKAESALSLAHAQSRALEKDHVSLTASLSVAQAEVARLNARPDDAPRLKALAADLSDVRDQLQDAKEELADAKKREQKGRQQLLEQLSTAEEEVSGLKTQLRQEQRKKKA